MRHLALTLCLLPLLAMAQSWAPIGAKWTYKQGSCCGPDTNLAVIEVMGDTLLAGRTYSRLEVVTGWFNCHPFLPYFASNADSVWYWDPQQEQEHLLFRWNALPGDTWSTPAMALEEQFDTLDWTVIDTAHLVIDGLSLRQLWMNVESRQGFVNGENQGLVTERSGGARAPFTWAIGPCDAETFNQLRCYEDAEIDWLNPLVPSCELVLPQVVRFDDAPARWYVADTYPHGSLEDPNFIETRTLRYFFTGDSMVAGISWHRMFVQPTVPDAPAPTFEGLVRQTDDLALFLDAAGAVDTLYDFGLEVGDAMRYHFAGWEDTYLTVVAIDSVMIQDLPHRRYRFSEHAHTLEDILSDTWIEGVGSIHGPLAPRMLSTLGHNYAFPDSTRTTCYAHAGPVLWQHPAYYPSCSVNIVLGIDDPEQAALTLFPNPASEVVHVNGLPPGTWSYAVLVRSAAPN